MITLIIILIYLLTVLGAYKFIQYTHYHKNGIWSRVTPSTADLIMIWMPFYSPIFAILFILGLWKNSDYRETNIFKPKKELK